SDSVGSPRRVQYPAAASRAGRIPATGPYEDSAAACPSRRPSSGCTGIPASPKASASTSSPAARRAAMISPAARVAETVTGVSFLERRCTALRLIRAEHQRKYLWLSASVRFTYAGCATPAAAL